MLKDQALAGTSALLESCLHTGSADKWAPLVFLIPPLSPPSGTQVIHLQVQCASKSFQAPSDSLFGIQLLAYTLLWEFLYSAKQTPQAWHKAWETSILASLCRFDPFLACESSIPWLFPTSASPGSGSGLG